MFLHYCTVKFTLPSGPDTPVIGSVALMVVVPVVVPAVTRPLEPGALLIVATPVFDELQITDDVKSGFSGSAPAA